MGGGIEDQGIGERSREEALRFLRRVYPPRIFGLALAGLCIGGTLWQLGAPALEWALLAAYALAWPHIAYLTASASRNPHRAELRNLSVDSAFGGAWIAAMHFNPGPSMIVFVMLAMGNAATGGARFLARCLALQALALLATSALLGFPEPPGQASIAARAASVPLLLFYPILVGLTVHRLARRVRQQAKTLAALSGTDELSGLLTQAHWKRAVRTEFHRCRRSGHGAAVMMIDVDRFKEINDRHGHPAGDEVIRSVAAIVRDSVRANDIAGRYGGDEFCVVLPGASGEAARSVAERIRARIGAAALEPRSALRATASIGLAALGEADAAPEAWIARADRALYRAKAAGRDRVELEAAPGAAAPADA